MAEGIIRFYLKLIGNGWVFGTVGLSRIHIVFFGGILLRKVMGTRSKLVFESPVYSRNPELVKLVQVNFPKPADN